MLKHFLQRLRQWFDNSLSPALSFESQSDGGRRSLRALALCVIILFVALGVRLLYLQDSRAELSREDTVLQGLKDFYEREARRIVEEGGLLLPNTPREEGDAWMIVHPPGYAILLAGFSTLRGAADFDGDSATAETRLRVLQIIADATAAVIIFLIAAELFPLLLAFSSGMLAALSPHFAYYSLGTSPDTLAMLPILLAVLLFIKAYKEPRFSTILAVGALLGLSCWLRANALLLAPFFSASILLYFTSRRRWRYALLLTGVMIVVIAPITIRNYLVYKQFIPLSIGSGITLIEGIAEYDPAGNFELPVTDRAACEKDVQWHNRPDYDRSPWRPDGAERDAYRFRRGLSVIGAHPFWFLGVMCRRSEAMFRFNDFRTPANASLVSTAPVLSAAPGFGSNRATDSEPSPVWGMTPPELLQNSLLLSAKTRATLASNQQSFELVGDESSQAEQFASPLWEVRKRTDYILALPVTIPRGDIAILIQGEDPRFTLARVTVSASQKKGGRRQDSPAPQEPQFINIAFASNDLERVRFVVCNNGAESTYPTVQIGRAELFAVGATPYQWTRPLRSVIRGIQKNIYKTDVLRLLIAAGVVILILAKQRTALFMTLLVPIYYLCVQSALHTEYRYILVMHYFLFILAAVTIYNVALAMGQTALYIRRHKAIDS